MFEESHPYLPEHDRAPLPLRLAPRRRRPGAGGGPRPGHLDAGARRLAGERRAAGAARLADARRAEHARQPFPAGCSRSWSIPRCWTRSSTTPDDGGRRTTPVAASVINWGLARLRRAPRRPARRVLLRRSQRARHRARARGSRSARSRAGCAARAANLKKQIERIRRELAVRPRRAGERDASCLTDTNPVTSSSASSNIGCARISAGVISRRQRRAGCRDRTAVLRSPTAAIVVVSMAIGGGGSSPRRMKCSRARNATCSSRRT